MSNIYNTKLTNGGYYIQNPPTYSNWTTTTSTVSNGSIGIGDNVLKVNGNPPNLEIKGTVVINGLDLEERLKTIEKILQIPERDAILEAKYPSLKKKYDEYIKALEKYRMWESIKGNDND